MIPKNYISEKFSFRISTLAITFLLLVGISKSVVQPVAAQVEDWGIPISEPAPEPAGRVTTIAPDPSIQGMIDQVNSSTVSTYDRQLAGELPVWVDGAWYTITSRYTYSGLPIQKATHFVGQRLAELGLNVEYHQWGGPTYPNVIGEIAGITQPDQIVIIGGHLDAVLNSPGADDNASGAVATLLAAEILSQYNWACTLRFAFWTGEEQGMLGSDVYAQRSYQMGEDIVGYLNLDMIAYNTIGSNRDIDVIFNSSMPPTHDLALLFNDVVNAYSINLIPELRTSLGGGSDHQSFWYTGYTAILSIEDQSDFNPYYHTYQDTPAHTDLSYFTDFVKASIGTFAHMGCLLPPSGALAGAVADVEGQPISGAHIQAQRTPQQAWETLSNPDGAYLMNLVSGVYTVTAQAPGYMNFSTSGIVVTNELTTTLDITLLITPTYVLTGYVRDALSTEPLSATVSVVGSPIPPAHTDPATGWYTISLMQGLYTVKAEHPGHYPLTVMVNLQADQQLDFNLPSICILVVGDDDQYTHYYTDSLERLGVPYQVAAQIPDLETLAFYQGAIWLTGDQVTTTLTQADQTSLSAYLDGGGRLFISGQNIAQDISGSPFFDTYLHANFVSAVSGLFVLNGLGFLDPFVDIFIQGGQGASNQNSPDAITPANGVEAIYQYWTSPLPSPPQYGGIAYTGTHRIVYFSFGFEAINRPDDRDRVMEATLGYINTCAPPEAPQANFTTSLGNGPHRVQFTNSSQGSAMMSYTWEFGDGGPVNNQANPTHAYAQPGFYFVTLTATSRYGQDSTSKRIFVPYEVYLPAVNE